MDPDTHEGYTQHSYLIQKTNGASQISEDDEDFGDGDTIPDEEYQQKLANNARGNLKSWPNNINTRADPRNIGGDEEGPNINLKVPRKSYSSHEEKKYFFNKIKTKQKTELCKNWSLYSACYFKDNCSFAHGDRELRSSQSTTEKYKTKFCKMFKENFYCNYGNRCIYLHVVKQMRLFKYVHLLQKFAEEFSTEFIKLESDPQELGRLLHNIYSRKHVIV